MILISKWAQNPVQFTDTLNDTAWKGSNPQHVPGIINAWLYLRNDAHFMYLNIDMPDETSNSDSGGDYFLLGCDVNKNQTINPNVDILYGGSQIKPGKIAKSYFLGPGRFTYIKSEPGDFEFAFEGSPKNSSAHKVWKLRIPLADFGINLSLFNIVAIMGLKLNVGGRSSEFVPGFDSTNFANMGSGLTLLFARNPVIDPALMGPVIAAVGLIPTAESIIDPTTGKATTALGYYVKAYKSAFAGVLNLIFNRNKVTSLQSTVAKYKVKCDGTELRSAWLNYRWVGNDVVLDAFGPDAGGFYTFPDAASQYSIEDLLIQFNSALLPNGIHHFTVEFYNAVGTLVTPPTDMQQILNLYIDNTAPTVSIDSIAPSSKDINLPDSDLAACKFATLAKNEGLKFMITVNDPQNNIDSFSFSYVYGNGTGGTIYSDVFDSTKPADWNGVTKLVIPAGGAPWMPPEECAYAFTLGAYSNTTNGYNKVGYNQVMRMVTIIM